MKIVKKIIIRVIVAIVVAFIFSKLKLLGIMEVSALEVWNANPSAFCVYPNTTTSQCDTNLVNRTYFDNRTFSSYTYTGDSYFDAVSFNLPFQNISNKKFHFSAIFLLNSGNTNDSSYPVRAYLSSGDNNSSCSVEGGNFGDVGYSKVYIISCENAFKGNNIVRLFINGPFYNANTLYALSTATIIYDNDELLALQKQNEHLQEIRNSINSTNSKLDELIRQQQQNNSTQNEIKNNTKETNDLIKDDSSISNDKITDITNIDTNTTNTPVSDFITLPITLLGKYRDGITGSCSSVSLGSMYGYNFVLPCISISSYIGNDLWHLIDMMISFFLVYKIAMMCLKMFEDLTSLKDPFDEAYSPKHADNGKHGEV